MIKFRENPQLLLPMQCLVATIICVPSCLACSAVATLHLVPGRTRSGATRSSLAHSASVFHIIKRFADRLVVCDNLQAEL